MTNPSELSTTRRVFIKYAAIPLYLIAIVGLSLVGAIAVYNFARGLGPTISAALFAMSFGAILPVLLAGGLSRITLTSVIPGKFPRDLAHHVYGPRRLYALCWTSIYYCQPLYHVILAVPALKWLTFRLFGYKGSLDFQTYPDTWIRDLPLLTLGRGVYLSNKATISPNMCLRDGSIVVLPISIGAGTIIGHLTMVAPGAIIGQDCDIGVGASVGLKATIGDRSTLGHCAQIDHQSVIGSGCTIGSRAYVGRGAVIHNGVRIPPGAVIPARTVLVTQTDVAPYTVDGRHTRVPMSPFRLEAMPDTSMINA